MSRRRVNKQPPREKKKVEKNRISEKNNRVVGWRQPDAGKERVWLECAGGKYMQEQGPQDQLRVDFTRNCARISRWLRKC